MIRNKYAISKDEQALGITLRVAQLRQLYGENGGPLTLRHRQFLRRFILPYVSENPPKPSTEFVILIPTGFVERAPKTVRTRLEAVGQIVDDEWYAARPWIGDPDMLIEHEVIDAELGVDGELPGDKRGRWDDD